MPPERRASRDFDVGDRAVLLRAVHVAVEGRATAARAGPAGQGTLTARTRSNGITRTICASTPWSAPMRAGPSAPDASTRR